MSTSFAHANRPAENSPRYVLWQRAWDRVHLNRRGFYVPTVQRSRPPVAVRPAPAAVAVPVGPVFNVQPHFVQQPFVQHSVMPTVNVQQQYVPQVHVAPAPAPRPVVQPVGPTFNVQQQYVPQVHVAPAPAIPRPYRPTSLPQQMHTHVPRPAYDQRQLHLH